MHAPTFAAATAPPFNLDASCSSLTVDTGEASRRCSHPYAPFLPCAQASAPSPSSCPRPSPYVTSKLNRLVLWVCRRVGARIESIVSKDLPSETLLRRFCRVVQRQTSSEIDRHFGCSPNLPKPKHSKIKQSGLRTLALVALPQEEGTGGKPIDRYVMLPKADINSLTRIHSVLATINIAATTHIVPLTAITISSTVFLQRKADFRIKCRLSRGTRGVISSISRLPGSVPATASPRLSPRPRLIYAANLEDLLRCLKHQLVRLFFATVVEPVDHHIFASQRDFARARRVWFSEFPGGRRPLCTTWPWNIKPSLAVVWGVCWMFYENHLSLDVDGNMVDRAGQVILHHSEVGHFIFGQSTAREFPLQNQGASMRGSFCDAVYSTHGCIAVYAS